MENPNQKSSSKKSCLIFMLSVVFLCSGCGNSPTTQSFSKDIESGKIEHTVIVIDSCEYIFTSRMPWAGDFSLTHKGNCKFCRAREEKNY